MSKSYGGSYSDRQIMDKEHDFLYVMRKNEKIFADHGFTGMYDWNIYTPPTERNELYSAHSHFRIISENMMKHIKEYASCREKMRYHLMKEENKKKNLSK